MGEERLRQPFRVSAAFHAASLNALAEVPGRIRAVEKHHGSGADGLSQLIPSERPRTIPGLGGVWPDASRLRPRACLEVHGDHGMPCSSPVSRVYDQIRAQGRRQAHVGEGQDKIEASTALSEY